VRYVQSVTILKLACTFHISHPYLRIPKAVKLAAQAGFDAFEISPSIPRQLTRGDIRSIRSSLKRNKLAFAGFTSIYPPEMILASKSTTVRRKSIVYTKWLIETVSQLEGRHMVWGSGRSRNIPKDVPFRKGLHWLVDLLRESGTLADNMGIKIAIEPQNRFESTIIHNVREALSLAKLVKHESIGVVYDTFHTSLEEDSFTKPILLAGKRLASVHVSDCNRKIPGKGHINFSPIFQSLKRVRYDGYISLEAILGRDPHQDLISARRYMAKMIE
jgi:sugar phosphate isomerase/epimerase